MEISLTFKLLGVLALASVQSRLRYDHVPAKWKGLFSKPRDGHHRI